MEFPKHKCGLYLTHNQHRDNYEDLADWLQNMDSLEWESEAAKQKAIEIGQIWTLQWYPDTPIGFHCVAAPTLEDVLRLANDGKRR